MVKTQVPGSCSLEAVFVTLCNGSCFRTNSQDHNFLTIKKIQLDLSFSAKGVVRVSCHGFFLLRMAIYLFYSDLNSFSNCRCRKFHLQPRSHVTFPSFHEEGREGNL